MAIQFLDNQPLTWRTSWATDSNCKVTNEKSCTLYSTNDYLFAQWKQTPCGSGANILCNTDFTNGNTEKVTNGSFTSNSTGWTLGTGVTRDAVNHWIKFPGTTLTTALTQAVALTNGTYYDVTFTIGGMTKGSITPKLATASGTAVLSSGTHTQTILANGTSGLTFSTTTFDGWIDDISVKVSVLNSGCFTSTYPNEWIVGDGIITKIAGHASQVNQNFNTFNVGSYMKVTFRVSGYSAGTLNVYNGTPLVTVTSDGVYEAYFTSVAAAMVWDVTADFSGSISEISVVEYSNYYSVLLKDTKNLTEEDMSGSISLHEDWVILKHPLFSVDPGCYELCVYDACGYGFNNEIIADGSFDDPSQWTYDNTYSNISGGKYNIGFGFSTETLQNLVANSILYTINPNTIVFDFSIDFGAISEPLFLYFSNNGNDSQKFSINTGSTTYTGTVTLNNCDFITDFLYVKFESQTSLSTFSAVVDNLSIILQAYVPGQMTEYCSNCIEVIDYPDTDLCTQWVGGTNGEDSFGFHFDPTDMVPFQIGARVRSMMINPKYKGEIKKYATASGNNIVTRSNSDKVFTLFIDRTDEHTHDWLRLAVLSDTVKVGNYSGQANINYVNGDGDYQPEWPDNLGTWPSAQARVELSPKTGTLYNNNAG